eukprot:9359629-Lingulodinium_polyedra.AAC.1
MSCNRFAYAFGRWLEMVFVILACIMENWRKECTHDGCMGERCMDDGCMDDGWMDDRWVDER